MNTSELPMEWNSETCQALASHLGSNWNTVRGCIADKHLPNLNVDADSIKGASPKAEPCSVIALKYIARLRKEGYPAARLAWIFINIGRTTLITKEHGFPPDIANPSFPYPAWYNNLEKDGTDLVGIAYAGSNEQCEALANQLSRDWLRVGRMIDDEKAPGIPAHTSFVVACPTDNGYALELINRLRDYSHLPASCLASVLISSGQPILITENHGFPAAIVDDVQSLPPYPIWYKK